MTVSQAAGEMIATPDRAITGWRIPDRERDRLVALHRISTLVARQRRTDDVLREALQCAVSLVGADAGAIHRWLPERNVLRCAIAIGRHEPIIRPELKPGVGLTGRAFVEQRSIVENDYARSEIGTPHSRAAGLRTGVAVPISHGGNRLGILSVGSYHAGRTFGAEDVDLLELFAVMVAVALENAELNASVRAALEAERAANEQLERLNRAKSGFVAVVSHELRSPLAAIQGFSEPLRDEVTDVDEMREYAADINREAERLNRMIDELLDLDRMESGKMTLRIEPVDAGEIVRRLVASAGPRAPGHRLRAEVDPALPAVSADRDKLTQVIVNLLDNALKYSPDGGDVVVGARADGNLLRLWVRDRGLGIPADALEAVFDRYARVESARHRTIRGVGLGLPIVRHIVELHGGRIWVESTYGSGSTFHVTMPLICPPVTPGAR